VRQRSDCEDAVRKPRQPLHHPYRRALKKVTDTMDRMSADLAKIGLKGKSK
jgi:hypothetical protein